MSVINNVKLIEPSQNPNETAAKNSTIDYLEGARILLILLENVLKEPKNDKFRIIRKENKNIKEKLLSLKYADTLLKSIGFRESASEFILDSKVPLSLIEEYHRVLKSRREAWTNSVLREQNERPLNTASAANAAVSIEKKESVQSKANVIQASKPYRQRITFPQVLVYI